MADPNADPVLNAMRQKLEMYQAVGMTEQAKQVEARIAKREKSGVPKAPPMVVLTDVKPVPAPTLPSPSVKKTAKRAAKK